MKIRNDVNEFSTPVTIFECEFCGVEFSVCPAVPPEKEDQWAGCLAPGCPSYDPGRDADLLFDEDGKLKPGVSIDVDLIGKWN